MIGREQAKDIWQGPELVDTWMVTFADLLTLLVTLFVLLLSMNQLKVGITEYDDTTSSKMGVRTALWEETPESPDDALVPMDGIGEVGARIMQIKGGLSKVGLIAGIEVYHDQRGAVLRFDGAPIMTDGTMTRTGSRRMTLLADYLKTSGRVVAVTGVADTLSDTGWSEAALTASRVADRLIQAGVAPVQVLPVARVLPFPDPLAIGPPSGVEFIFSD